MGAGDQPRGAPPAGEQEYLVAPLALSAGPPTGHLPHAEWLLEAPAVALFIARARANRPDFPLTEANMSVVAAICAQVDGLPLAIILAATHVKVLPLPALLQRLERRLPLLTGVTRDLEARQQTMRASLAWSEDLLEPEEQHLFRRLSVFVGGCTLEGTEAVCAAPEGTTPLGLDVLEALGTLVDHSLAWQREETDGAAMRFGMLQVIREYALEQLVASGEAEALRRAHANHYMALAERAELELTGPDAGIRLDQLEHEHDNLRAVLGWAQDRCEPSAGLRLAAALIYFWRARGYFSEGRAHLDRLLSLASPDLVPGEVRAGGQWAAGSLALWQGDYPAAEAHLEVGLTLAREAGDLRTATWALNELGILAHIRGDQEQATPRFEDSLAAARELGDIWATARALNSLGQFAYFRGDWTLAEARFREALTLFETRGDGLRAASCRMNLGQVALKQGEVQQAKVLAQQALARCQALGAPLHLAGGLEIRAMTEAAAGNAEQAARWLGTAVALRERLGTQQPPDERADMEREVASARAALGEERWGAAYAAGRALTLEEAVAEALGEAD